MICVNGVMLPVKEGLAQLTLSKGSHREFDVSCDSQISELCRKNYKIEFRQIIKLFKQNGNILCLPCSRRLKASGRQNPNARYPLDDFFFSKIENEEQAYLLGWIASDGHIAKRGFKIRIHQDDLQTIERLRDIISKNLPIIKSKDGMVGYEVNSRQISTDLCKLLKIRPGKKDRVIHFPKLSRKLLWHFLRGFFEGDGYVNSPKTKLKSPRVTIRSMSPHFLEAVQRFTKIKAVIYDNTLILSRREAVKFLERIYKNASKNLLLERKYQHFLYWKANYIYGQRQTSSKEILRRQG